MNPYELRQWLHEYKIPSKPFSILEVYPFVFYDPEREIWRVAFMMEGIHIADCIQSFPDRVSAFSARLDMSCLFLFSLQLNPYYSEVFSYE